MKSSTEVLRALLDERGVHWWAGEDERKTLWKSNGLTWEYFNDENGDAWLGFLGACEMDVSPEQAIAATLGSCSCSNSERTSGTCHDSNNRFNAWQCSECGATMLLMFDDYGEPTFNVNGVADVPHFCPNCGRRVEQ